MSEDKAAGQKPVKKPSGGTSKTKGVSPADLRYKAERRWETNKRRKIEKDKRLKEKHKAKKNRRRLSTRAARRLGGM